MTLRDAHRIIRGKATFGDSEQLRAAAFIEKYDRAMHAVMKELREESDAGLVKAILWGVTKHWNDHCGMDQYLVMIEARAVEEEEG